MITGQDTGHVPDQDDDLNPETEEVVAIDVDLEVDQEIANVPVVTVQGLKNREEKEDSEQPATTSEPLMSIVEDSREVPSVGNDDTLSIPKNAGQKEDENAENVFTSTSKPRKRGRPAKRDREKNQEKKERVAYPKRSD